MGTDAAWQLLDQNTNQGMQRTNAKRPHFMAAPLSFHQRPEALRPRLATGLPFTTYQL
jgi:hypothetical protein